MLLQASGGQHARGPVKNTDISARKCLDEDTGVSSYESMGS